MRIRSYQTSLNVLLLCSLIYQISALARVENNWSHNRRPNATVVNNQWPQSASNQGWNSPTTGRYNQTLGNNSWTRNNQTQQYPASNNFNGQKQPTSFAGTTAQPQLNNPWIRNNLTTQPYYPQNPQNNNAWNTPRNAPRNLTYYGPTTPNNVNNIGRGSSASGFGQHNPVQQYPGGIRPPTNTSTAGWNARPSSNMTSYGSNGNSGWNAPNYTPQPHHQNPSFGGGWAPAQPTNSETVPLATISGGTPSVWNAGGHAGLSYANGPPLQPMQSTGPNAQQRPGGGTNPYSNLFN